MLRFRKTRRTIAMAGAALALATGATVATGGTAFAGGSNWQNWAGNCFGYTLWSTNQVTGYVVSHNSDWCNVSITQYDSKTGSDSTWTSNWTQGALNTPKWWHGWGSDGGLLTDWVCVSDWNTGQTVCSPNYN